MASPIDLAHSWMAALIPDEKWECVFIKTFILLTNAAAAAKHPGLVTPSTTNGAPLWGDRENGLSPN